MSNPTTGICVPRTAALERRPNSMTMVRDLRVDWARRRLVSAVLRARDGDRAAFEQLWERHARLVHAILLSMASDQEAEDMMQEVALAAWQSLSRLEEPERFTPWLSAIARNRGRDLLKRSRRVESMRPEHEEAAVAPNRAPAALEADEVMAAIRALPEPYREPLTLRLVLELSAKEISERTGLTPGSVRVNLCRGMKILRAALEDEGTGR